MKKRIIALASALALLLPLGACSGGEAEVTTAAEITTAAAVTAAVTVTGAESTAVTVTAAGPVSETEPVTEAVTVPREEPATVRPTEPETTVKEVTTTERSKLLSMFSTLLPTVKKTETTTAPQTTKSMSVRNYTKKQLMDYFAVTALHNENGVQLGRVIKWNEPVRIYIIGNSLDKDVELINKLCRTLNKIDYFPGAAITDDAGKANVFMLFAGSAELSKNIENFSIFDDGYCGFVVDPSFNIKKCIIGINSGMVSRKKRDSVICEELMQAMGLPNDSDDYKESIFHRGSDSVTWPSDLDWGLAVILYNPGIKAGMKEREARAVMDKFVKS